MIQWKFIGTNLWFSSKGEESVQLDSWKAAQKMKISPDTQIIYKHDITNDRSGSVIGAVRNGDQSNLLVRSLPEPTPTPEVKKAVQLPTVPDVLDSPGPTPTLLGDWDN